MARTDVWTTGDGRKIRVCDMDDEHIVNAMQYMNTVAMERRTYLPNIYWAMAVENNNRRKGFVSSAMKTGVERTKRGLVKI